jgi:TolB-like protein/Flp pilus assembly protein TadD
MESLPKQAVFLSYASEDSAPALRICEALRAAGIEVWFDQSELRGGDAWDRQIRKQVHDCALFVALVSKHSDARTEGYFRREWRLAVERTHDMADDAPFLLPVAIDDTVEARARVPDQFREVQWTRLPGGAATAAFIDRVRRLLSFEPPTAAAAAVARVGAGGADRPGAVANGTGRRGGSWRFRPVHLALAAVVLVAGFYAVEHFRQPGAAARTGGVPESRAQALAAAQTATPEKSVAVLPFVNMSADKDQEYFADGLSEELINLLAKIPELHVSARTSSFYFKGKPTLIADVAKALGVANVLEGSVRKSGKTVRVTAQLVRADNGYPIWSDTYDRPLNDIFKIQDDIAASVIDGLKLSLLGARQPRAWPTANTEAYNLYLRAQSLNYLGSSPADLDRVIGYLKQALKVDPAFAPAWALLANTLGAEYALYGTLHFAATRDEAHAAAQRALKLDPDLPLAHLALGRLLHQLDWKWDPAEAEFQKAIALEPGSAEPYRLAGYLATTRGRFDKARGLLQRAVSADPLQPWNYAASAYVAYRTGDLESAEAMYKKAIELSPTTGKFHYVLASLLLVRGQTQAALVEMQRETNGGFRQCGLVLALDALGKKGEADQTLADAVHSFADKKAYLIALIYAQRHQSDQAFAWLDRAVRQRDGDMLYIQGDPMVSSLLPDPRYKSLMQRMQLAD